MAKKEKTPLTPEQAEIKALKKNRRAEGFLRFLACVLALAITIGVVAVGKSVSKKSTKTEAPSETQAANKDADAAFDALLGGDDASTGDNSSTGGDSTGDNSSTGGDSSGGGTSNSGGSSTAAVSKADAVKLLNDVTAAASKGNYSWKRNCAYTPDGKIDVGNATGTLNNLIKGVDSNASLDSVVGNFIGIGDLGTDVKGGKLPEEGMSEKHLLKAMTLTEGDVVKFANKGTTYLYQLNQCKDPKKDGTNALSKATDDFITHEEVVKGITDAIGSAIKLETSQVTYDSILIQATINGGKLTKLTLSYTFSAVLNLKAAIIPITGTGKAKMTAEYSNIAY